MTDESRMNFFNPDDYQVTDLQQAIAQAHSATKQAVDVVKGVPIYDAHNTQMPVEGSAQCRALQSEWAQVLRCGAGVLVLRGACADLDAVDAASAIFEHIIEQEKAQYGQKGDHFSGTNDRIWNSLQKLCLADPDVFINYHSSLAVDLLCKAWLGPNYQMTAQINLVHPGGQAQKAHRDYHLGFQGPEAAAAYPAHVHDLSPVLTLQGALAHCAMPIESGPTKLLPGSQTFRPGYLLWQRDEFRDYFEDNFIQLPLDKGDALFFNPALFHAAGSNISPDIQRMANLLQVSSAFGRAMERIDRDAMSRALYPTLLARQAQDANSPTLRAAVACCAEGYSFPTNLDLDPPGNSWVPESQQALMLRALAEQWSHETFCQALDQQRARRHP